MLKKVLKEESCNLIDCFCVVFFTNFMKANTTKFQAICIGKRAHDDITSFNIDSAEIKCEDNVTLLGINIDFMLRFDDHPSKQLAAHLSSAWSLDLITGVSRQGRAFDHG